MEVLHLPDIDLCEKAKKHSSYKRFTHVQFVKEYLRSNQTCRLSRPLGWIGEFLNSLAVLNLPLSTVQSTQARQLITRDKSSNTPVRNVDEYLFSYKPVSSVKKKGRSQKRQISL